MTAAKKGNERPFRDDNDIKEDEMPAGHMKDETAAREGEMPTGTEAFRQVKEDKPIESNMSQGDGSNEFRSTKEPKRGFISGNTFDWKPIEFSEINGIAIFEGDIALGTVEELQKMNAPGDRPMRAVVITGNRFRWPQGVVPYEIDPNLPNQQRIDDGIRHWEQRTGLRFVRRDNTNSGQYPNFIRFEDQGGCWSFVGMRGGRQVISLGTGCSTGNTIHEIGHAIGLWHEQSREDRDTWIRINWQNIDPNQRHNFDQHITDGDDVGPYDYCSIMHYPRTAFSINGQATIEPLRQGAECMGQRNGLSDGDTTAALQLYPRRGWASRGGVITSDITTARNADGRLELFVRGTDNALWHMWQTAPSNGWSGWSSLGGVLTSNIAVGQNADGRLELFVRGTDNALWHKWQTAPSNGWSGWSSLGGVITSQPIVTRNADGRLELLVRGTDGAVWHKWQTAVNNGWSGWASRGGVITSDITTARNADGRLELFVRGTDNALWHMWQTAPSNGWSGWSSLGGVLTSNIAVGQNADGRLELFVRGTDNALWHKWQTAPSNGWSGWSSLGGVLTSEPVLNQNADGRLEVFVRGTDGAVWHMWQTAPSNGWSGWASRGGVIIGRTAVDRNADGRLEVFVRGTDGAVWHIWQTAPSNGWSF